MSTFIQYRKKQIAELRPFVAGETLPPSVSVNETDKAKGSPKVGDMIARNPADHEDQWLVEAQYFLDNFVALKEARGTQLGIFVPGVDTFERAEFDAAVLADTNQTVREAGNPKLTFRTNTGQSLTFQLGASAEYYDQLVQWATDVAAALRETGR